ncbi:MAG TPA: hypothetical protein VF928_00885 [Usitatibacteraceae bacterium]
MQTATVNSSPAASAPASLWKSSNGRAVIYGVCIALACGTALAISAKSTSQVVTALTVIGIEGNAIVEFDTPAHSAMNPHYRVDCSAVGSNAAGVQAEASSAPVVVAGLEAGQKYDCRASITADAGTIKSVRVHAVGQD